MKNWPVIHLVLTFQAVAAIFLNSVVIYLFMTRKYLRNVNSNVFLLSLSISDLCFSSSTVPLLIKCEQMANNPPPLLVCYIHDYVITYFGYTTVYHILLGITEKLFAICYAIKHHLRFCKSMAIKLSVFVWLLSFIFAHIPIWWDYILYSKKMETHNDKHNAFLKFHFASGYAMPFVMSSFMCFVILRKIIKVSRLRQSQRCYRSTRFCKEKQAALAFAIMLGTFLLSWSPWFLARIDAIQMSEKMYFFVVVTRYLVPILNPLLYSLWKNDFRKAFKSMVKKKVRSNHFITARHECHNIQQISPTVDRQMSRGCLDDMTSQFDSVWNKSSPKLQL